MDRRLLGRPLDFVMSIGRPDRSAAFVAPMCSRIRRDARVVQELTIDLAEKRRGTIKAYRSVADPPAGPSR
jgi:hypothetical protein